MTSGSYTREPYSCTASRVSENHTRMRHLFVRFSETVKEHSPNGSKQQKLWVDCRGLSRERETSLKVSGTWQILGSAGPQVKLLHSLKFTEWPFEWQWWH